MHKLLLCITICLYINTSSYAQEQSYKEKYKNVIHEKYDNIKKKISNDSLIISGSLKAHLGLRTIGNNNTKPFEYRVSANAKLSYRSLDIPVSYSYSNGRSIYRVNGPNYNVPSFKNLGVSPKYKWATAHIGTRTMSFSKYSYDNLRFIGAGIELTPENYMFKAFKGRILQTTQQEASFLNTLDQSYHRDAWGTQFGYKTENQEYSLNIFKATDDIYSVSDSFSILGLKPKENVVLGMNIEQEIIKDVSVKVSRSVSALTRDLSSDRIAIKTHSTVYNMLGLYEKKESSIYAYATKASLLYKTDDADYSFNYEKIDKGYRSLGSLLFDNDFRSYTVGASKPVTEKITVNTEVGLRTDGLKADNAIEKQRIIGNINVSYLINDYIFANGSYSNFRNTEKTYFQSVNSLYADSLFISLVNQNLNLTTTFFLNKDKTSNITLLYSNQNSNQIQHDSVSTRLKNISNMWSSSYSYSVEKWNLTATLTYLRNRTAAGLISSIIPNGSLIYTINDRMKVNNNITFNYLQSQFRNTQSLIIRNDYSYDISKKQRLIFSNRMNFANQTEKFKLLDQIFELDYSLRF